MTKYKFIGRDGKIEYRELVSEPVLGGEPPNKVVINAPAEVTGPQIAKLARAMFDRRFSQEATVKGEGNVGRALDIMFTKTKTQEAMECLNEARQTLSLMKPEARTYIRYGKGDKISYIEQGTVFVDATDRTQDDEVQRQLFAQGNPPPTSYPLRSDYMFRSIDYNFPLNTPPLTWIPPPTKVDLAGLKAMAEQAAARASKARQEAILAAEDAFILDEKTKSRAW